ncbi:MAG: hypothetical protein PWQ54_608, partial [Bacteroidales bacterium]|nr:hypothetical protein [Bacteroidales bacterium]
GYGYGYYSDEGKDNKPGFFKRLLNKI